MCNHHHNHSSTCCQHFHIFCFYMMVFRYNQFHNQMIRIYYNLRLNYFRKIMQKLGELGIKMRKHFNYVRLFLFSMDIFEISRVHKYSFPEKLKYLLALVTGFVWTGWNYEIVSHTYGYKSWLSIVKESLDKVWHAGLVYKLICLIVPMYIFRFIKSFLTDQIFRADSDSPSGSLLWSSGLILRPTARSLNISYSGLFADGLNLIFIFRESGQVKSLIRKYLQSLNLLSKGIIGSCLKPRRYNN